MTKRKRSYKWNRYSFGEHIFLFYNGFSMTVRKSAENRKWCGFIKLGSSTGYVEGKTLNETKLLCENELRLELAKVLKYLDAPEVFY